MELLWITSRTLDPASSGSEPCWPPLPCRVIIVPFQHFSQMPNGCSRLTSLLGRQDQAAVVIEICPTTEADDEELAREFFAVFGESRTEELPLWLLHHGATDAEKTSWLQAGASHVAGDVAEIRGLVEQLQAAESGRWPGTGRLVGISRSLQSVAENIRLVANKRCNVLIEGETGTGKEVVARGIHATGARAKGPWVAVNCGAIPDALLEAELFGHVKGAFTGAVQSCRGSLKSQAMGRSSLTKSVKCRFRFRQNCFGYCRSGKWRGWAGTSASGWTFG